MPLWLRDIKRTVSYALADYAVGDIEGFLSYLAEDVVYRLHLDQSVLPFAGEVTSKDALRERLLAMRAQFEYLLWSPGPIRVSLNGQTKTFVDFSYKHKRSGKVLDGSYRLILTVDSKRLIRRIEEYHDAARVHAFVRLMESSDD